jgi:hypothetical protein
MTLARRLLGTFPLDPEQLLAVFDPADAAEILHIEQQTESGE